MEKMKIAAGIVLYNPEIQRLCQNIAAILPQVDKVYVVDNASNHWNEIEPILQHVVVKRNKENLGIAYALNQLMQMGQADGMQWVLTLDQDSVCPDDLISKLSVQIPLHPEAGILCPVIVDRSFGIENSDTLSNEITPVKECITSASLTNVKAWHESGGFDERLFIDAVDTDFCLTLHEHGWEIIRVNSVSLLHEIGRNATLHKVGNRKYVAFNHPPFRYYYIARNMVYLSRKHQGFLSPAPWRCILTMMARMLVILIWEKYQRIRKCRNIIRGIIDGCSL